MWFPAASTTLARNVLRPGVEVSTVLVMGPVFRVVPGAKVDVPQVTIPERSSLQLYVTVTFWFSVKEFATPPMVDGATENFRLDTVGATVSTLTGTV